MNVHKKCQPIRSSRLAGHRKHIYECLVLSYRFKEIINVSVTDNLNGVTEALRKKIPFCLRNTSFKILERKKKISPSFID